MRGPWSACATAARRENLWVGVAVAHLRAGRLVAHATEGVWGFAADPWQPKAVERLLSLKQRALSRGLILVAADKTEFAPLLEPLPGPVREQIDASWPGPTTWVVPHRTRYPRYITGGRPGVAVRVTDHVQFAALARRFGGPLVSSSANPAGSRPALTARQVRTYFRGDVPFVLPGKTSDRGSPSTVRAAVGGQVLRA